MMLRRRHTQGRGANRSFRLGSILALAFTVICHTQAASSLVIVARTGQAGLTNISASISLNNSGWVAFQGRTSAGMGCFAGNGLGALQVARAPSDISRVGACVQMNDQNLIVGRRGPFLIFTDAVYTYVPFLGPVLVSPAVSTSDDYVQTWARSGQGPLNTIAHGETEVSSPPLIERTVGPFASVGSSVTINNIGQVAFVADAGTPMVSSYVLATPKTAGGYNTAPGWIGASPMIADNGSIVVRNGRNDTDPILLYDYSLTTVKIVAAASQGFTALGRYPGISDDGQYVAFYGNLSAAGATNLHTTPGPGIFLSVLTGQGIRTERLASLTNDDGVVFSAFDPSQHTGIAALAGAGGETLTVFTAFDAQHRKGLFRMRRAPASAVAGKLECVIRQGDPFAGGTLGDLSLFDPVNTQGEVAFFAVTETGSVVAKAALSTLGTLQVNLLPPEAVDAGARWRVDGGTWQTSGAESTPLEGGSHLVEFLSVTNWIAPANQTVMVNPGQTGTSVGTYILPGVLRGMVVAKDADGVVQGPIADARVSVVGASAASTDTNGVFELQELHPGTLSVKVTKDGYYDTDRTLDLQPGESKYELFYLTSKSTDPTAFDIESPNGKNLIEGMPGHLSFSASVAWNGPPGTVRFNIAGSWYDAQLAPQGEGLAQATVTVAAPGGISACSELAVEVTNGEGRTTRVNGGVHFFPIPGVIIPWYRDNIPWTPSGLALTYADQLSRRWPLGPFDFSLGYQRALKYDLLAGVFEGSIGATGGSGITVDAKRFEVLGQLDFEFNGRLEVDFAGCSLPSVVPGWEARLNGKLGVGAPVVEIVAIYVPPMLPVIDGLLIIPVIKEVVGALKVRMYFVFGGAIQGEYEGWKTGACFLGATSTSGSLTGGFEAEAVLELFGAEAGFYAGGTLEPEWELCPELKFDALTGRGYAGVFASALGYESRQEIGVELKFDSLGHPAIARSGRIGEPTLSDSLWRPIGNSPVRWGPMNAVTAPARGGRVKPRSISGGAQVEEETVVTNVTRLTSPSLLVRDNLTLLTCSLQNTNPLGPLATDIVTVQRLDRGDWSLSRISDDPAPDFSPRTARAGSNTILAVWTSASGDLSNTANPAQVAPHLEIVASALDQRTGLWSPPEQLTTNNLVDRDPVPAVFGSTLGVLWIQNAGGASIGDATNGDRLMFVRQGPGGRWAPATLWSGSQGILGFTFVADGSGEGHVVFTVDVDGNLDTRTDRELLHLSTTGGVWQAASRLTRDEVEDSTALLLAPNGVPLCVWNSNAKLTYTRLTPWAPKPLFADTPFANYAAGMDGTTLPGGAALAYTVQATNGVDIVAAFYDAPLDRWSLPTQLTHDDAVESALTLCADGTRVVLGYLKTQTVRTNLDLEIAGQIRHLENIPRPGRTDLCLLKCALGQDMAVVPGSLFLDPPNPAPGTAATVRATIENQGELAVEGLGVTFYDGDPEHGGVPIAAEQVLPGTWVGGDRRQVAVPWTVPRGTNAHEVFVVVDPASRLNDRDRSNNRTSRRAVLPDLVVSAASNYEVSSTTVALIARISNSGVIPSRPTRVSWRVGTPGGTEIGTSRIDGLAAGQTSDISCLWDATRPPSANPIATVYAVVNDPSSFEELDFTNNSQPQKVRLPASESPRFLGCEPVAGGSLRLTLTAQGLSAPGFVVEGTDALTPPIHWTAETQVLIQTNAQGQIEAVLPPHGAMRFYRVRTGP